MFFYEFCDISKNIFVTEHLRTTACALAFPSNFTKMGTANCVLKTSDEYSLSRKVNLRSIVQVSFLSRQHKLSVYVFITTRSSRRGRGVRKKTCFKKLTPVSESLFNKFEGLTPILENICQRLLLYCTCTLVVPYPFYFIFSTYRSSHWRCSVKKRCS